MSKYLIILVVIINTLTLSAQSFPLEFSPDIWEFGTVTQRKVINKAIQVVNISDKPVGLYRLTGNHSNLTARAEKTALQPGESTTLHIQFQTQVPVGAFESGLNITLVADARNYIFTVKGNVVEAPPLKQGHLKPDTAGIPVLQADSPR